jgi:hypothetical protein
MAARKTPSKGGKPDKLMRHALLLELHQQAKQADGKVTKRLRLVARKLVDRAEEGDTTAIREIFDRVDGRVPQAQHVSGPEGGPVDVIHQLLKEIDGKTRGLPPHALAEAAGPKRQE